MTAERDLDARPSALNPLQRYVGSWRGEVTVQVGSAEPSHHTQHNTFSWVLGERFLQERGESSDGSSFLGLWKLDVDSKYRAHYFLAPTGDVVALTHEWDEQRQSFQGTAELGAGLRILAEDRFLGPDTYEWSFAVLAADGSVLTRTHAREQRVPATVSVP